MAQYSSPLGRRNGESIRWTLDAGPGPPGWLAHCYTADHLHCFQLFAVAFKSAKLHALMTSTTLPLFWNLSSNTINERLDASVKLIGALEIFQAHHAPAPSSGEGSEEDEENENEGTPTGPDKLDELNAPDVAYSIRRLVRGLASPRESSRLGFAVALTEVYLTRQ
jgi:hypothetical protein